VPAGATLVRGLIRVDDCRESQQICFPSMKMFRLDAKVYGDVCTMILVVTDVS
jgi:hypothetical protein